MEEKKEELEDEAKKKARAEADKIMKDAERQADNVRKEAKKQPMTCAGKRIGRLTSS